MLSSLTVINIEEAKYECIYGRGCDGICCQNGRPPMYPDEVERTDDNLERILPLLRPAARALVEKRGYLSKRTRGGLPLLRVVDSWCVFFNGGCVLHKMGMEDGDVYRHKPVACALFPLARDDNDQWYIRQKGYNGEIWDLFCLDPNASPKPAQESLKEEMALAQQITEEEQVSAS